jgi:hypothetical protein
MSLFLILLCVPIVISDWTRTVIQIKFDYLNMTSRFGSDAVSLKLQNYQVLCRSFYGSCTDVYMQIEPSSPLRNTPCSYLIIDMDHDLATPLPGQYAAMLNGNCSNSVLCTLYPDIFLTAEGGSISQSSLFSGCVGFPLGCNQRSDFLQASSHQIVGFVLVGLVLLGLLVVLCVQGCILRRRWTSQQKKSEPPIFSHIQTESVAVKFHL